MSIVQFEGKNVELVEDESALEGLLRSGFDIPNSCRSGLCQSCVLSVDEGSPDPLSQKGLSPQQVSLNHVLACQCKPEKMLSLSRVNSAGDKIPAKVIERTWLNKKVLRLRVTADIAYRPGQYLTLWRDHNIARCYSIASHPVKNDFLEFHIKYISDGKFSAWAGSSLSEGQEIYLQGPLGKCVYSGNKEQPLLLAAIGTGLAPIWGILQDAIVQKHEKSIHVVIGAANADDFYLIKSLKSLQALNPNIDITFIAQDGQIDGSINGDIYTYCKERFPSLAGYGIYLCGAQSFVNKMRKQCFITGAGMSDIVADPFIASSD